MSLTVRKKHRLRVFENGLLRKIFWSKAEEITWEWRRLHNEELYNLHSLKKYSCYSSDHIKKDEMGAPCGMYGREERCIHGLSGET